MEEVVVVVEEEERHRPRRGGFPGDGRRLGDVGVDEALDLLPPSAGEKDDGQDDEHDGKAAKTSAGFDHLGLFWFLAMGSYSGIRR